MESKYFILAFVCVLAAHAQAMRREKECSVVKAGYRFSFSMYKELISSSKNVIFSPYSIHSATAMVMLGASGETESELKRFLQYGLCHPDTHRLHNTHRRVREYIEMPSPGVTLTVANKLFPDTHFKLKPDYTAYAQYYYGSSVESLDFMRNPEGSRNRINEWAADNTNGIIQNLLPPGSIDSMTQVVLANAIYFKGTWKTQFKPRETTQLDFYVDDTTTVRTDFMSIKSQFKYASNALFSILELPYSGESASMIIVLPTEKFGLSVLEDRILDGEFLRALNHYGHPREVTVKIPKFKMDYSKELMDTFINLGVTTMFGPSANFSAISESSGMFISEIRHKAYIEVNEEGTEAAAATAFAGTRSLSPFGPMFMCDHPFLFYIVHKPSNAILFLGRYVTPTK